MFVNTLKRKLLSGEHCFGILDSTCSPEIVEMLGYLGFDFVLLDAEHGKLNLENLENLIRAAELSGTAPIVRPPVTASEWISPMLDRGAWGVYLPHFSTVEDAEGLDNLDDMLKVEGIDAFWIGAGDLSQSMGYPGQADHPVVMEAMDEAVRKIVAAGKVAGWAGADHLIPRYVGLGALLFHGLVQGLVRTGADAYLKQRHDEMAALAG